MAQFRGFSYDDLSKPLDEMQKAHNEVITDMAGLSQNSEILDYYLDPERDKDSYNLYNKFKTEFNFNAEDFARNGLTRNNGMKLLNLHRNYNNNVANVLDAIKNRETERAEQQKIQEQSKGQTIFGLNGNDGSANNRSVDFYLKGNKGYVHQNLDEVRDEAKNFAAAASKRKYTNNFDKNINPAATEQGLKALAGEYWMLMEQTGYNDKAAYNIINYLMDKYEPIIDGTDDGSLTGGHPDGFIKNMRRMLQERNIDQFSDKDKLRLINAYINGIDEGLTYTPKYDWQMTKEMRQAGAAKNSTKVIMPGGDKYENDTRFLENLLPVKIKKGNEPLTNAVDNIQLGKNKALKKNDDGTYTVISEDEYLRNISSIYDPVTGEQKLDEKLYNQRKNMPSGPTGNVMNDYLRDFASVRSILLTQGKDAVPGETISQDIMDSAIKDFLPQSKVTYEMNIPKEDKLDVIAKGLTRGGTQVFSELAFDPVNNQYEFEDSLDGQNILKELKEANSSGIGITISLVDAPTETGIWQVMIKSSFVNGGNPFYMPLSAVASMSGKKATDQMYTAYQTELNIMKALENDKSKRGMNLYEKARKMAQYELKDILQSGTDYSNFNIKPFEVDEREYYENKKKRKEAIQKALANQNNK